MVGRKFRKGFLDYFLVNQAKLYPEKENNPDRFYVYEVKLPTGLGQGYRALSQNIEVTVNGPGINKARAKIRRTMADLNRKKSRCLLANGKFRKPLKERRQHQRRH